MGGSLEKRVQGQSLIEVSPSGRFERAMFFRASGDSLQAFKKRRIMVASDSSGERRGGDGCSGEKEAMVVKKERWL